VPSLTRDSPPLAKEGEGGFVFFFPDEKSLSIWIPAIKRAGMTERRVFLSGDLIRYRT
jgi:hypothetical protein